MNEREIITLLAGMTGQKIPELICGIGDDCAVIRKNGELSWLVTMDTLVETVHFDRSWHPPDKLGRKTVAVNVSDIAAMGGQPLFAFLSIALPAGFPQDWFLDFSRGITSACQQYGCILAGGDTVRTPSAITLTLTVIGEVRSDRVLMRDGARVGDTVWISGFLGRAAAGLELCRTGRSDLAGVNDLIDAHLDPQPRLKLGQMLAESGLVNAMMDLSDGLATDLAHLCYRSGVGATIEPDRIPAAEALLSAAAILQQEPQALMLSGGEDYELLFTAPGRSAAEIAAIGRKAGVPVFPVGNIDSKDGVRAVYCPQGSRDPVEEDITFSGYDHFAGKNQL